MNQRKTLTIVVLASLFFIATSSNLFAASIYVDNTLSSNCTGGNYSVSGRNCNGSNGNAYRTIQSAINSCSVGDTIYMRGGTYSEIAIDIPESKNGSSWASGNFTTLRSLPGEWAIVDGSGLNTSAAWYDQAVFSHPNGYGAGDTSDYTRYWVFSNFEVTGGRTGFFLKADHIIWRYMYIHDNGRSRGSTDTLVAGILSVCPRYALIEYSYFANNIQTSGADMNNSNILFDSDYEDSSGRGGSFNENAATHHNEVRYNYMVGSKVSLRQKNQQRFGYNDRNPNTMTYKEYGDKWHHNIILNGTESIGASQDFIQIYKNITDSTINFGRQSGSSGDVPIVYNAVIYNNTVKRDSTDSSYGAFATSGGYDTSKDNYYDSGSQSTVHEHGWYLNNIAANNSSSYQDFPFMFHWNIPQNTSNPGQDNSDLIVDNNLIYANNNSRDFVIGHNTDASGCGAQYQTVSSANSCFRSWTGDNQITNWESSSSGLFVGSSGANAYKINANYSLDGSKQSGTGGYGASHPYLSGVTIPSYIGAVNPDDNAWVDGVLTQVSSVSWLRAQNDSEPGWIEGGEGGGGGGEVTTPSQVEGFILESVN